MLSENIKTYEVSEINVSAKGLTGYVIKYRLAKDKRSAERTMLITSIIFFVLSLYFFAKAAGVL